MYEEKYKKYKLKYLLLKKNMVKLNILAGGDKFSESKHFNSNLNYVVTILNNNYGGDWAFTGSTAVVLLARDQGVLDKFPELNCPNDYDVLIQNNTPISTNKLDALEKIPGQRDKIIKSVTFQGYAFNDSSDATNNVSLDLTFLDRSVRIKMYTLSGSSIRVVHPSAISSSYEDDLMMGTSKNPESDSIKKRVLDEVVKKIMEKESSPDVKKSRFTDMGSVKRSNLFDDEDDDNDKPAGGAGAESSNVKRNLFGDD